MQNVAMAHNKYEEPVRIFLHAAPIGKGYTKKNRSEEAKSYYVLPNKLNGYLPGSASVTG